MRAYIQDLLQMSKGVRRFIASESLLGIGMGLFILVFNLHLLEIGFSEAEIGKITSMGTIIMGIFSVPSSLFANWVGRKKMLVSGLFLIGVGYLWAGLGTEFYAFYLAQMLVSIGLTCVVTSEIQLLFHYSRSKKEETKAFSILFAIFTLFTGVGTLLGGFIPKWFGGITSQYQSSLIIASIFVFAIAIVRAIILPKEENITKNINPFAISILKKQITNKNIWVFSFFTLLMGSSHAIVIPFINIIVKFRLNWGDEWVSTLLAINGFFLFIGSVLMPYVLERLGRGKAYTVVFLTNILLTMLLYLTIPVSLFAMLLLLRGGFFMMITNMVESQTMQATSEDERNLFAGLRAVLRSGGSAVSNYAAGMILALKNYSLPFLVAGIIIAISYIYYLYLVKPIFDEADI